MVYITRQSDQVFILATTLFLLTIEINSLNTTTDPKTQTEEARHVNTIGESIIDVTRQFNSIPQSPDPPAADILTKNIQIGDEGHNSTKGKERKKRIPEPEQTSPSMTKAGENSTKSDCACHQDKDKISPNIQDDQQEKRVDRVAVARTFQSDPNRPHKLVPHHLDNYTFLSLNMTLRKAGDAVTVEWQYASNATTITGFVVCYRISKREDYDSSKLGLQVRSFTLHNLHKDEDYDICVHVMINTKVVREVCATWSEDSNKMVVGILAGLLFLVPCVAALIWLIRKDSLVRKRYKGLMRDNKNSDIFVAAENQKDAELEAGTYKQKQQTEKRDTNKSELASSITDKSSYHNPSDNSVKDTVIKKPLMPESSHMGSINTADEQKTCSESHHDDVQVKVNDLVMSNDVIIIE